MICNHFLYYLTFKLFILFQRYKYYIFVYILNDFIRVDLSQLQLDFWTPRLFRVLCRRRSCPKTLPLLPGLWHSPAMAVVLFLKQMFVLNNDMLKCFGISTVCTPLDTQQTSLQRVESPVSVSPRVQDSQSNF